MREITVRAPMSVSNVVCGFDCLGFALEDPFELVSVRRIPKRTVLIAERSSFGLPTDPRQNVAGVALLAMLDALDADFGFEVEITKSVRPGSGIGSSAASSCGAVSAANLLLDEPFSRLELAEFAMRGEELASGARHADNVAPCIFGGFTLVRSITPLDIVELDFGELLAVVIHPQIEIRTSEARAILPAMVPLGDAVRNWSNLGAFVAALSKHDNALLARSMEDLIIEPARKTLIPEFDRLKSDCLASGALGGGISGSGPSIFMLCETEAAAQAVKETMCNVYDATGI